MSAKQKKYREHWYSGITEGFMTYFPGNRTYRTIQARRARKGTLFILPFIIGFIVFMVRPLFMSLQMSFNSINVLSGVMTPATEKVFSLELFGLKLFEIPLGKYSYALQTDPKFNGLLVTEMGRMAVNTVATLVLSFVIAVILNQKFKGRLLCRVIFFLPVILSSGVLPGIENSNENFNLINSINQAVQESGGVDISASLEHLLNVSGVGAGIFDVVFQMINSIYDIVMASGIQIIVFLSGLQAISPSLYEAADVEGCSAWESFWKITFPMVSPLLLVNCIYTIIDFFMKNDNTVMEHINQVMYGTQMDFGAASAESWIYFGVALVFIGISTFIITRAVKSYE